MKTSCIPICFFSRMLNEKSLSLEDWIRMAADIGLDGIEMYKPFLESLEDEAYLRRASDAVRDAGLAVSMFTSYAELSSPDEAEQRRQMDSIRKDVELAEVFDTDIIRMTCGRWPDGISRDDTLRTVADGLRRAVAVAAESGVTIAVEDHPDVGTKIEDFLEILELVNDERLKVNLDTSNPMVSGQSATDLAPHVAERVVHVHVSDRHADGAHSVTGEGAVDFPTIFRILYEAGFDGWLSMEAGGPPETESIERGLDYLRKTWASVVT